MGGGRLSGGGGGARSPAGCAQGPDRSERGLGKSKPQSLLLGLKTPVPRGPVLQTPKWTYLFLIAPI